MDLLKRYLNAVQFWLPANQQNDVIAELSEDLRSQADDRESALGRSLTPADWESILKERGHPLVIANGYLPQRYLIGPVLFPVYLFVLKLAVLCCLIPSLAVWLGMTLLVPASAALHPSLWGALWPCLFTTIPVTAAFSIAERYQRQWLANWSPSKLPIVRDTQLRTHRIPRSGSLIELVVNAMFAGWAIQAVAAPALIDQPGARIAFTALGRNLLAGLISLAAGLAIFAVINLAKPYWTRTRHAVRAAFYGVSALLFAFAVRSGPLVDLRITGMSAEVARIVDYTLAGTALGAVVVSAVFGAIQLRTALRRDRALSPVDLLLAG